MAVLIVLAGPLDMSQTTPGPPPALLVALWITELEFVGLLTHVCNRTDNPSAAEVEGFFLGCLSFLRNLRQIPTVGTST